MHLSEEGTCSRRDIENTDVIVIVTRSGDVSVRNTDNNESMHCFKFFESTSTRPSNDKIMSVLNSKSLPPWRK